MDLLSVLSLGAVRVLPPFDLVLAALVLVPSGLGVIPLGQSLVPGGFVTAGSFTVEFCFAFCFFNY